MNRKDSFLFFNLSFANSLSLIRSATANQKVSQ
jgi:hypothetical protein